MPVHPNHPTSPVRITHAQRVQQALDLRRAGCTYNEIGRVMKVRAPRVCQLIKQGMSGQAKLTAETADNVRALEISRIDGIVMAHWPNRAAAKSADILLRASERRCKLLGLDAPTKLAPTTPDGKPLTPTVDLSKLTDDQLAQMEALYEAAGATLLPAEA